jgi:hypothetical protein
MQPTSKHTARYDIDTAKQLPACPFGKAESVCLLFTPTKQRQFQLDKPRGLKKNFHHISHI